MAEAYKTDSTITIKKNAGTATLDIVRRHNGRVYFVNANGVTVDVVNESSVRQLFEAVGALDT